MMKPAFRLEELLEKYGATMVREQGSHRWPDACPCPGCGGDVVVHDSGEARCDGCAADAGRMLPALGEADAADDRHHAPMGDMTTTTTIQRIEAAMTSFAHLKEETPTTGWLWHGYLAQKAVTLLSAKPKAGKSTLVFDLLRCMGDGQPCCGRSTRRARVLYVSEESASPLREKADKLGLGAGAHVTVLVHRRLDRGVTWAQLVGAIGEMADRFDVVVFDTYNALAGFRGDQENGTGDQLDRMAPVKWLAERGLAVLLITHDRKSEGSSRVDQIRGGNALVGEADIIVQLDKVSGDATARVLHGVGRFDATPTTWTVRLEDGRFVAADDAVAVVEQESHAEIAELLDTAATQTGGWLSARAFAPILELSDQQTKRRLDSAVEAGYVRPRGNGTKSSPTEYAKMMVVVTTSAGDDDDGHRSEATA